MSNGALLFELPGSGKLPASSLAPLAAITHPVGGLSEQSGVGLMVGSGISRFTVAAWIPTAVHASVILPLSEIVGLLATSNGVALISVVCPAATLTLLRTAYVEPTADANKS